VAGAGSTFWFTARFDLAKGAADFAPGEREPRLNRKVLVADGNASQRSAIVSLIQSLGCRSEEACSPEDALEKIRAAAAIEDPFNAAVLDAQMPGAPPDALARMIRDDPAGKPIRLLRAARISDRKDPRLLGTLGYAAQLAKPLKLSALKECLDGSGALGSREQRKEGGRERGTEGGPGAPDAGGEKRRVLLVEDNAVNQKVALKILEKLGVHADAVGDGREALEALESLPYDLVLMDCQMPDMDGFEATREIRTWEQNRGTVIADRASMKNTNDDTRTTIPGRRTPIIALTANALKGDRERCLEAGMDDYLPKPMNPADLAGMLDRWLPKPEAGEEKPEPEGSGLTRQMIAPAAQEAVVFDRAAFIERLLGDTEVARTIAKAFLEDMPVQIQKLAEAVKAGDALLAGQQAHRIKGAAANVGGEALREAALEMEKAGRAEDRDTLHRLFPKLEKRFAELQKVMEI